MSLWHYQLQLRQPEGHAADNHHNPFIHNDFILAYIACDNVPELGGLNGISEIGGKSRSAENPDKITNASHYTEKY
jgi:hypothetical protein